MCLVAVYIILYKIYHIYIIIYIIFKLLYINIFEAYIYIYIYIYIDHFLNILKYIWNVHIFFGGSVYYYFIENILNIYYYI